MQISRGRHRIQESWIPALAGTTMKYALGCALLLLLPDPAFAAEGLNGAKLSILWALPFVGILLCIATGPVFYTHVWEHHFGKFTAFWAALIVVPLFLTADVYTVTTTLAHTALLEYMPFILLLLALFVTAGGIYLEGNLHDSVFTNTVLLASAQ
jgi:CDP-diglyceride synthetase